MFGDEALRRSHSCLTLPQSLPGTKVIPLSDNLGPARLERHRVLRSRSHLAIVSPQSCQPVPQLVSPRTIHDELIIGYTAVAALLLLFIGCKNCLHAANMCEESQVEHDWRFECEACECEGCNKCVEEQPKSVSHRIAAILLL